MDNSGDKVHEFNSNQYEVFRIEAKPSECIETKSVKWKYFACALFINVNISFCKQCVSMFLQRNLFGFASR